MGSPRADAEPSFAQLRVQGLCRSVGGRPIHQNLTFSVASGETLFVVGPSGVGKSLLLRELACLGEAWQGPVLCPAHTHTRPVPPPAPRC